MCSVAGAGALRGVIAASGDRWGLLNCQAEVLPQDPRSLLLGHALLAARLFLEPRVHFAIQVQWQALTLARGHLVSAVALRYLPAIVCPSYWEIGGN